jgi:hypothetical protein
MAINTFLLFLSFRRIIRHNPPAARLYLLAILLFSMAAFLSLLSRIGLIAEERTYGSYFFSALLGIIAVAIEIEPVLSSIWTSIIGKLLLAVPAIFVASYSIVFARREINNISKLDASNFPSAITVLAAIYTLMVWLVLGVLFIYVVFIFYIAFLFIRFLVATYLETEPIFPKVRKVARVLLSSVRKSDTKSLGSFSILLKILVIIIIGLAFHRTRTLVTSGVDGKRLPTRIFVHCEFFDYSDCSNQKEGERVAFLKDGRILVAHKDSEEYYSFEIRNCK